MSLEGFFEPEHGFYYISEPLHWVEYSLLHTMDVKGGWFCDWWMCYLNYQIEHHLFPTMPQFRHPQVAPRVAALAKKHGLPYRCESYWKAAERTYNNLNEVSKELREMQ
jgi:fatty acid desaturase 2 (delta-6 desaturase)